MAVICTAPVTTTGSPTVAFLTAAAVAAAGIAYWSSTTNTTALGSLVLEVLGVTTGASEAKSTTSEKMKDQQQNRSTQAFISWLDREQKESNFSHPRDFGGRKNSRDSLNDPRWMSEAVRNALLSTAQTIAEKTPTPGLIAPFRSTEQKQGVVLSSLSKIVKGSEEPLSKQEFLRCFKAVQKTTEAMIRKIPTIREDHFNGICLEVVENGPRDERKKEESRRRSSSFSSTSSTWSGSTSMGSYVTKEDSLVEEEEEVERLLAYLRFVELAKEEASSPTGSTAPKEYLGRNSGRLERRIQLMVPDTEGYEILRSTTMDIQNESYSARANVGLTAAVHRNRKELVIAVHFDGTSFSSPSSDSNEQINNLLESSLCLQHQDHYVTSRATDDSSSSLLLDQAVEDLSEDILRRYLLSEAADKETASSSFLSSGYSLTLTGHSMGAALSCRLGDALRHREIDSVMEAIDIRVYAFGPPPCLPSRRRQVQDDDYLEEDYSYITSVVNNHDCIPRWTESNLNGLRKTLQWTMDRKRRHFQRYHKSHARPHPSTMQASSTKASVVTRPPPRIPPLSMSSRDMRAFWKSYQEPSTALPHGDINVGPKLIVPGKIVSIWNHSQDPTIIGAKVHCHRMRRRYPSSSDCLQLVHNHNTLPHKNQGILGRLWVDEGMFSDHTIEAYRSNLELLLGQVANTI